MISALLVCCGSVGFVPIGKRLDSCVRSFRVLLGRLLSSFHLLDVLVGVRELDE